jgi:transcriptional regulator with XRE-family HTH domain
VSNSKKIKPLVLDKEVPKVGARIKQLRIKAGYTNADDFATDFSYTSSAYRSLEKGRNIELNTLIRILNCHGMTYVEFFNEGFD